MDIASDYSICLGRRASNNHLTITWFRGLIQRWPELHLTNPRALEVQRPRSASAFVTDNYFVEVKTALAKYK